MGNNGGGKPSGIVSLFVAAVVGIGIYGYLQESGGKHPADTLKNPAFIICQNGVKRALKTPATADFPLLDFSAGYLGKNLWTVSSYVDSENSFGATLRTKWTCKAKYISGDPLSDSSWKIQSITTK